MTNNQTPYPKYEPSFHKPVREEPSIGRLCISPIDVATALGIGKDKAYELIQRDDFPKFRHGRRIIVPIAGLEKWLSEQAGY